MFLKSQERTFPSELTFIFSLLFRNWLLSIDLHLFSLLQLGALFFLCYAIWGRVGWLFPLCACTTHLLSVVSAPLEML